MRDDRVEVHILPKNASSTWPHRGQASSEVKWSGHISTPQSLQWSDLYGLATTSMHLKQTPFERITSSSISCTPQYLQLRTFVNRVGTNRSPMMVIYKQIFLFNWITQHFSGVNKYTMSLKEVIALLQDANKNTMPLCARCSFAIAWHGVTPWCYMSRVTLRDVT